MQLNSYIAEMIANSKDSLLAFLPELTLCGTILLMLLVKLFDPLKKIESFHIALVGSLLALTIPFAVLSPWQYLANPELLEKRELFGGMLVMDTLTVFMRMVLMLFAVLFVVFTKLSGIPDKEDGADFYTLLLGATLGMCIMASSNHLLAVFLGIEMASVPSYALAGMLKGKRTASEAALKYSIYGAGAAGVMLYGISLLAGLLNSAHLPTMAVLLAEKFQAGMPPQEMMVLSLGGLMVGVGLAFKLSAVPFHFWAPDVFEGASAEVGAFLSVASKAAALALLVRVGIGLTMAPVNNLETKVAIVDNKAVPVSAAKTNATVDASSVEIKTATVKTSNTMNPQDFDKDAVTAVKLALAMKDITQDDQSKALAPARDFVAKLIAFLAVITCTFGNLAAYGQTNIKRLLAYSTIAHAGYMMMPVAAAIAVAGYAPDVSKAAIGSLLLYIAVYLFMNLAAFATVAFLRNVLRSENIADYAGLVRRCPGVVVCFTIILFSLVGLPPLAGFVAKFAIFASLVEGYEASSAVSPATFLMVLLVVGGINTAISLFYYVRVAKTMILDPEPESRPPVTFPMVSMQGMFLCLVSLPVALLIVSWNGLNEWALAAAKQLLM